MKTQELLVLCGVLVLIFGVMGYGLRQNPYSLKPVESSKDKGQGIPKIVYQTFKTKELTPRLKELRKENSRSSPSYSFELWDDAAIDDFIRTNFPINVYRAFKKINPKFGAARADFWRYCILYKKGGVYMDIKTELLKDLDAVITSSDKAILDLPRVLETWREGTFEQWFLAYEPKHPYLRETIRLLTDHINSGVIPECIESSTSCPKQRILKLTGPDAYTQAIETAIAKYGVQHRTVPFDEFVSYGNEAVKLELYSNASSTHYSQVEDNIYVW
jgi:inositol phosphorylceramide mannosyltransferase catalytic subunit